MNKIKKIMPIILSLVLVFGSCLSVNASTYNIDTLSEAVLSKSYPLYNYNFCYFTGLQYVLVTSDSPCRIESLNSNFKVVRSASGVKSAEYVIDSDYNLITKTFSDGTYQTDYSFRKNFKDNSGVWGSTTYSEEDFHDNIIESQYDILYANNEVFFHPVAPIQEALVALPETINNQLAVILTIAVACLALLVTLSVLRKKLPSFL